MSLQMQGASAGVDAKGHTARHRDHHCIITVTTQAAVAQQMTSCTHPATDFSLQPLVDITVHLAAPARHAVQQNY